MSKSPGFRALVLSALVSLTVHSANAVQPTDPSRTNLDSESNTTASGGETARLPFHLGGPRFASEVEGASAFQFRTSLDAMTDNGQIVGHIWLGGNPSRPFLWDRGVFTDLDPQGEWQFGQGDWYGVDVNRHGQVIASPGASRAVLFDHGHTIDLTPEGNWAVGVDLNDRGDVLGLRGGSGPTGQNAFLWSDGEWTDLGGTSLLAAYSGLLRFAYGLALNDHGTVIAAEGDLAVTRSFLWSRGVKIPLDFVVTAINNHDQVIGNSGPFEFSYPASSRAYLWEKGKRTDLGSLGGDWTFASAINDRGEVAGVSTTAAGEYHVFLWTRGEMVDLGGSASTSRPIVEEVNDRGQVVGFVGFDGFLWDHGSIVPFPRWESPSNGSTFFGPRMAIDDKGRVAFSVFSSGSLDTYLWEDGVTIPLAPEAPATSTAARATGARDTDGATELRSSAVGTQGINAAELSLASENPARGAIALRFAISQPGRVRLEVFDVRGTRIRGLLDEWQTAGTRMLLWDGKDSAGHSVPSGVYLSRLRVGDETRTLRMIVGR